MAKRFRAAYPGICACGDRFVVGDMVGYNEDGDLVQADCLEPELMSEEKRAELRKAMCSQCFLVHPGECW